MCIDILAALQLLFLLGALFFFPLVFLDYALKKRGQNLDAPVAASILPLKKYGWLISSIGSCVFFLTQSVLRHPFLMFSINVIGFVLSRYFLLNCN